MTQENVEIVRGLFDAMSRDYVERSFASYGPMASGLTPMTRWSQAHGRG